MYHWMLGEIETMAEWIERAIDQRDIGGLGLALWAVKELRRSPRWPGLMRKLNLRSRERISPFTLGTDAGSRAYDD